MLANVITTTLGKLRFRGHLRQEIGYSGVERVERTVAKGRERKGQLLQKGQKEGTVPEIRKSLWSWAGYELALLGMLLLVVTLQPLDP